MRLSVALLVAAAPLLCSAIWMDRQPSYKPYDQPMLVPPATSVPISGREPATQQGELKNPARPDAASLALGKHLFEINCALCHGAVSSSPGGVGRKLTPPPPGLDPARVRSLSDSHIYGAITAGFGRMPPFKNKLKPEERWHIVNYLRTRR